MIQILQNRENSKARAGKEHHISGRISIGSSVMRDLALVVDGGDIAFVGVWFSPASSFPDSKTGNMWAIKRASSKRQAFLVTSVCRDFVSSKRFFAIIPAVRLQTNIRRKVAPSVSHALPHQIE